MEQVKTIYEAVTGGNKPKTKEGVTAALQAGIPAETILKEGLIAAMAEVGRLFETGKYYVPEMLISARAMQSGLDLLEPHLVGANATPAGRVVIGTVEGDLHDIGKNLVGMMFKGAGFQVIDLGTNVAPTNFVQAVREHKPQLVALSALLTTTMTSMGATVRALEEAGVRDQVKVMAGGAPVTEDFVREIGADGYAKDASSAVRRAIALIKA